MAPSTADLPPALAAVGALAATRLAKALADLVEQGGESLNPTTVAAAITAETQSMLTATAAAMAGVSAATGAKFAPTGRFLSGAVAQMNRPGAPDPASIAQKLLKAQKIADLGDVGARPPAAPTIFSSVSRDQE